MVGFSAKRRQIYSYLLAFLVATGFGFYLALVQQCSHGHDRRNHHHRHEHDENVVVVRKNQQQRTLLPEEIAEEEDLKMMGAHSDHHHEFGHGSALELSGLGLWIHAMVCSLLVSLASLICLILLPLIFIQGDPSKTVVDSLALFGAGATLGDAFLRQVPHTFGGKHYYSLDHHDDHSHHHVHLGQSHSHSLKHLSIGLSILGGIVAFLTVEKLVRYVEEFSGGMEDWRLGRHHHHHHKHSNKLNNDNGEQEDKQDLSDDGKEDRLLKNTSAELGGSSADSAGVSKPSEKDVLWKRNIGSSVAKDGTNLCEENIANGDIEPIHKKQPLKSRSNLVFGYLNLFSDGVHNFTDGIALGSAFLLYGSVGGWSRTLFLLAHELPQEIGDFGILVRSGFSVSKALSFNFLSALVALARTALVGSLLP